jgi:2-haloalkanoic acid dehalogenase type II
VRVGAVTFDLDDTLWDNRPVLEAAEGRVQAWLERHHPRLAARFDREALRGRRHQLAQERPELAHDLTALRIASLRQAAAEVGCDPALAEAAFEVFIVERNRITLYADVLPVLSRLAGRYTLAALTNGNADVQRIGIAHLFDFALTAADVGASKPDPALFHAARRRAGLPADAMVHVGDDMTRDVAGAKAAGWRAVLIDRGVAAPSDPRPDVEPDAVITTLAELPGVLAAW